MSVRMRHPSRFLRGLLALCLAALAGTALSQDFPNRPITLVMPYAPCGPGDAITRVFAGAFQKVPSRCGRRHRMSIRCCSTTWAPSWWYRC